MCLSQTRNIVSDADYYENHHIIPKSLGGSNDISNLVKMTYKEHFIAHLLLPKMLLSGDDKRKMVFAIMSMMRSSKYHIRTSKNYAYAKRVITKNMSGDKNPAFGKGKFGKDNHFFGKTHSEQTKKVLSKNCGKFGKDNHFFGKTHSEQTKKVLSEMRSITIRVYFYDKEVDFINRNSLGPYLNMSVALGQKLLKPDNRHLWKKYNIKNIEHENKKY